MLKHVLKPISTVIIHLDPKLIVYKCFYTDSESSENTVQRGKKSTKIFDWEHRQKLAKLKNTIKYINNETSFSQI